GDRRLPVWQPGTGVAARTLAPGEPEDQLRLERLTVHFGSDDPPLSVQAFQLVLDLLAHLRGVVARRSDAGRPGEETCDRQQEDSGHHRLDSGKAAAAQGRTGARPPGPPDGRSVKADGMLPRIGR